MALILEGYLEREIIPADLIVSVDKNLEKVVEGMFRGRYVVSDNNDWDGGCRWSKTYEIPGKLTLQLIYSFESFISERDGVDEIPERYVIKSVISGYDVSSCGLASRLEDVLFKKLEKVGMDLEYFPEIGADLEN